jgi:hypothetical protein
LADREELLDRGKFGLTVHLSASTEHPAAKLGRIGTSHN